MRLSSLVVCSESLIISTTSPSHARKMIKQAGKKQQQWIQVMTDITVFSRHMIQVQTCDCRSAHEKKVVPCYACVPTIAFVFHKHWGDAELNLLGSHFLTRYNNYGRCA